ncbi:MAG TPA: helix-turn-helix domain-containing protein [Chloroflexaceae bacterium]|nr:helix-turn-helix domain-containing protein [Chloroflexaceae bacterium]
MSDATHPEPSQSASAPPLPELLISDLETVRIIADPIRLRILELLVMEPQPVKRLAASLELPQTKLYYHINLLEERGLIRVVGTRVVSGIIEKQYGAVASSYRVDQALLALSAPGADDTVDMMFSTMLDGLKQDLRRGIAAGLIDLRDEAPDERKITLGRVPMRLTPERAAELHERLGELIKEFCPNPEERGAPAPGTRLYHLFVAYFPTYIPEERPDQE